MVDPRRIRRVTEEQPSVGRRDRKRRATKEALTLAALDLFEEHGFSATTIDDITERADVARRTFFRHFPSKEAVLFPDPEEYEQQLVVAFEQAAPEQLTLGGFIEMFAAAGRLASDDDLRRRRLAVIANNHLEIGSAAWESFTTVREKLIDDLALRYDVPRDDQLLQFGVTFGLFIAAEAFVRWTTTADDTDFADEILSTFELVKALTNDEVRLDGSR